MGTISSVQSKTSRTINVRENNPDVKPTNCPKHWNNSVTHYNERTNELYCLTCYQDYTRRNPRGEQNVVFDINKYVSTIHFKQAEVSLLSKLQNNRRTAEHQLLQISQNKKTLENKKDQFIEEIKVFVKTLVELITHLEMDLCNETNKNLGSALDELERVYKQIDKQLEKITSFSANIENNSKRNDNAARVDTMIKCKGFLKKYNHADKTDHAKNYEPLLRLNKSLTLKDIVGKGGPTSRVTLGSVTCDERADLDRENLSDISETTDEMDTDIIKRNGVARTTITRYVRSGRVSGQSQSTSPTKRIGNASLLVHGDNEYTTPNTTGSTFKTNSSYDVNSDVSRASTCSNDTRLSKVPNLAENVVAEDVDQTTRNPSRTGSKQVEQIERISTNPGRLSDQHATSPRKSSQSIVSPGNISTSIFSTPRPGAYKETMERRIAEKLKVVALPREQNIHNITDTVIFDDGRIVLCDQKNEKLILMNEKQEIVHDVKVNGHPHNVTIVPADSCKVAVTIPDENVVKIIEIYDEGFSDQIEIVKLQSKPKCRGIEYVGGNLVYTARNDVTMQRKDGTWKFKYAFRQPVSLFANRNKNTLFVSCYGINNSSPGEVVKMKCDNESIEFLISCPEINHPVCTTVDSEGYVYVCDTNPASIHQVTNHGGYCRRLLSASDGKFQHVNFIPGSDIFITTQNDCDTVCFYCMK